MINLGVLLLTEGELKEVCSLVLPNAENELTTFVLNFLNVTHLFRDSRLRGNDVPDGTFGGTEEFASGAPRAQDDGNHTPDILMNNQLF